MKREYLTAIGYKHQKPFTGFSNRNDIQFTTEPGFKSQSVSSSLESSNIRQEQGLLNKIYNNKEALAAVMLVGIFIVFLVLFLVSFCHGTKKFRKYLRLYVKENCKQNDLESGVYNLVDTKKQQRKSTDSPSKLGRISEEMSENNGNLFNEGHFSRSVDEEVELEKLQETPGERLNTINHAMYLSLNGSQLNTQSKKVDHLLEIVNGKWEQAHHEQLGSKKKDYGYKYFSDNAEKVTETISPADPIGANIAKRNTYRKVSGINANSKPLRDEANFKTISLVSHGKLSYDVKNANEAHKAPVSLHGEINIKPSIKYSRTILVKLEPVKLYQIIERVPDEEISILNTIIPRVSANDCSNLLKCEKTLNNMIYSFTNSKTDEISKQLLIIEFINFSVSNQRQSNPQIYLRSYNFLINKLIESNGIKVISGMKRFAKYAFIEIVVRYCMSCWKFEDIDHSKLNLAFEMEQLIPYLPSKVKLFKLLTPLLSTGLRTNLINDAITLFATPPTPCMMPYALSEALALRKLLPQSKNLLQYLKRMIDQEHTNCCLNNDEHRHWQYTSPYVTDEK